MSSDDHNDRETSQMDCGEHHTHTYLEMYWSYVRHVYGGDAAKKKKKMERGKGGRCRNIFNCFQYS